MQEMQETWVQFLGQEDHLEKEMTTHSSVLAWKNPMNRGVWWATVHRVAKNWTRLSDWAHTHTPPINSLCEYIYIYFKSLCSSVVHVLWVLFLTWTYHTYVCEDSICKNELPPKKWGPIQMGGGISRMEQNKRWLHKSRSSFLHSYYNVITPLSNLHHFLWPQPWITSILLI